MPFLHSQVQITQRWRQRLGGDGSVSVGALPSGGTLPGGGNSPPGPWCVWSARLSSARLTPDLCSPGVSHGETSPLCRIRHSSTTFSIGRRQLLPRGIITELFAYIMVTFLMLFLLPFLLSVLQEELSFPVYFFIYFITYIRAGSWILSLRSRLQSFTNTVHFDAPRFSRWEPPLRGLYAPLRFEHFCAQLDVPALRPRPGCCWCVVDRA